MKLTLVRPIGIATLVTLSAFACSSEDGGDAAGSAGDAGTGSPGADAAPDAPLVPAVLTGRCGDAPPRGAAEPPALAPYSGGSCPTLSYGTATKSKLTSSGVEREFMVIVPEDLGADEELPLLFLWHWLGGSAQQFADIVAAQQTVNQERFIAVIPESIGGTELSPGSTPISRWRAWAAPNPDAMRDEELRFFDDMVACVSEQLPVDRSCISSAGVSDGALFTSQLLHARSEVLASAVVLSGGVSDGVDVNAGLIKTPLTPARPVPTLALWGGETDVCIILQFEAATQALEASLSSSGAFVVECEHNCGHAVPPIDVIPGQSLFTPFIDFVRSHPYWTTPGHSLYEESGLPASMPPWCSIGIGNAVGRTGACLNRLGC